MNCPLDGAELRMTDRQGVEVDYCPKCRGVWLDRGELDKLIARGDERDDDDRTSYQRPEHDQRGRSYDDGPEDHRHRRKKSFWGELFDFD